MSATNLTLAERIRFEEAETWLMTTSNAPSHARVAAGEPRGAREGVTPQGVAGSTPAPGSTCTESLCEHGIGAVGELW